jgi:heme/copper-type cytochrome/quinol oxidase subunit 3
LKVLSISLANPAEVLLATLFVMVAFAAFIGTFVVAIAYVYSNVFERWPEYTTKKRWQVARNISVTLVVIATLILLASNS